MKRFMQAAKLVDGGIAVQGDQVYVTNVAGDVWVRSVDSVEFPRKFQGHARSLGNIYAPEK